MPLAMLLEHLVDGVACSWHNLREDRLRSPAADGARAELPDDGRLVEHAEEGLVHEAVPEGLCLLAEASDDVVGEVEAEAAVRFRSFGPDQHLDQVHHGTESQFHELFRVGPHQSPDDVYEGEAHGLGRHRHDILLLLLLVAVRILLDDGTPAAPAEAGLGVGLLRAAQGIHHLHDDAREVLNGIFREHAHAGLLHDLGDARGLGLERRAHALGQVAVLVRLVLGIVGRRHHGSDALLQELRDQLPEDADVHAAVLHRRACACRQALPSRVANLPEVFGHGHRHEGQQVLAHQGHELAEVIFQRLNEGVGQLQGALHLLQDRGLEAKLPDHRVLTVGVVVRAFPRGSLLEHPEDGGEEGLHERLEVLAKRLCDLAGGLVEGLPPRIVGGEAVANEGHDRSHDLTRVIQENLLANNGTDEADALEGLAVQRSLLLLRALGDDLLKHWHHVRVIGREVVLTGLCDDGNAAQAVLPKCHRLTPVQEVEQSLQQIVHLRLEGVTVQLLSKCAECAHSSSGHTDVRVIDANHQLREEGLVEVLLDIRRLVVASLAERPEC
mmetsp:Transcript_30368/g.86920  ORF Transcript_30368/g.86920 Transcript_30368/m.86920 type:complete len:555 (+) Transcript_30368:653-2317(+)